MLDKKNICIRLKAYDHRVLDASSMSIVNALRRSGATVGGPIPLSRSIRRFTVLRSPHVDKKSREQFEKRICHRAIYVSDLTSKGVETLMDIDIPAGVRVEIKT